jgi:hypothetical protein
MKSASRARGRTSSSVRQSVTPADLAIELEAAARKNLNASYRPFMAEADPERRGEAGKERIRSIFGKDAIAEDPIF